ncbi:hypothetical protein HBH95_088230 [Parastagonospora nodorum]|nr:hypothetical protein HBH95_088230 [Parastagonospora nodorum]
MPRQGHAETSQALDIADGGLLTQKTPSQQVWLRGQAATEKGAGNEPLAAPFEVGWMRLMTGSRLLFEMSRSGGSTRPEATNVRRGACFVAKPLCLKTRERATRHCWRRDGAS